MKVVTIVGARPQFIKAAAVSRAIRNDARQRLQEVIVHTGQHYDDNMSKVFFDELAIPEADHDLGITGGSHGEMTGRMLEAIERVLLAEHPDAVIVYGDTNSTLAGALAAAKLQQPVAHVEAGLRSFNRRMPEEINRIVADRLSSWLFCPTDASVANLRNEGITERVHRCGDVMFDVSLFYRQRALARSTVLATLGLDGKRFVLATCHRAENADDRPRLESILTALQRIAAQVPVVLPLHPRTRRRVDGFNLAALLKPLTVIEPQSFLDMVALEQAAAAIVTDSGGVQKEAFFFDVPCVTMREETEWVETVTAGANALVGADCSRIVDAVTRALARERRHAAVKPYGDGDAAQRIIEVLANS